MFSRRKTAGAWRFGMVRGATDRRKLREQRPAKWLAVLLLVGIPLTVGNAFALVLPTANGRTLSGTYSFHAVLKRHEKSFAASGSLAFDWLGDLSGEARLIAQEHRVAPAGGARCHVLLSGNYSPSKEPGFYHATVAMVAVTSGCPVADGKTDTVKITFFRRGNRGDLGMLQTAKSGQLFAGAATLESAGPS